MIPLPSHSLKQWGQPGEILGGVRCSDETPSLVLYAAHAWGSSVKYRQTKDRHATSFGKILITDATWAVRPIVGRPTFLCYQTNEYTQFTKEITL